MLILVFLTLTLCMALVDIAVKSYIEVSVKKGEERSVLRGRVRIRRVHNKGMCLSLFEDSPQLVKGLGAAVTIVLTIYHCFTLMRKGRYLKKAGLSLMAAGAFSNTFDRLVRGYVIDYVGFQTKWEKITKITYNLGDFFIAAGAFLLLVSSPFRVRKRTL